MWFICFSYKFCKPSCLIYPDYVVRYIHLRFVCVFNGLTTFLGNVTLSPCHKSTMFDINVTTTASLCLVFAVVCVSFTFDMSIFL